MANTRKLSTQIEKEKKFIHMKPGRLSLRPKGTRAVQLNDGTFAQIDTEPLFYETEGHMRSAMSGRMLDPDVPRDKEILDAVEALLIEKPWMATDERYQIAIYGEFDAVPPWRGYDDQSAADARATFLALPPEARPKLEEMMKYELSRTEYDEDLDEDVSITDEDKVKMLNGLYREIEKEQMAQVNDTVDLG